MKLTEYLASEVVLILHHVEDVLEGLDDKDLGYAKKGLNDIKEVAERMAKKLPPASQKGVDQATASRHFSWLATSSRFGRSA